MDEIKKLEMWSSEIEEQIAESKKGLNDDLEFINRSIDIEEELGYLKMTIELMLDKIKNIEELKRLKNNIESRKKVVG